MALTVVSAPARQQSSRYMSGSSLTLKSTTRLATSDDIGVLAHDNAALRKPKHTRNVLAGATRSTDFDVVFIAMHAIA